MALIFAVEKSTAFLCNKILLTTNYVDDKISMWNI